MNFKKYHVSRNLINSDKLELGYLNTLGNVSAQDSTYLELTSDFIPVTETNYSWSLSEGWGNRSGWVARCFYNESKGMIDTRLSGRTSETSGSFQIPSGTAYIRISWRSYGTISLMLNTGSQPLPYEPYSSEVWHDTPHYIHNTSTDTFTTLPADVYADGNNATVGLVGNMSQASGVSPTTPIQPQECGERTGNLWDGNYENGVLNTDGTLNAPNVNYNTTMYIPTEEKNYTLSVICNYDLGLRLLRVCFYDENKNFISYVNSPGFRGEDFFYKFNFTAPVNSKYLRFSYIFKVGMSDTNIMLNTGSTALPYEPYGYKLDISSANTTTLVYLGEVETTRKIKKLVLTGEESFASGSVIGQIRTSLTGAIDSLGYCTHYIFKAIYGGAFPYIRIKSNTLWFEISPDGYETKEEAVADFKTFVAAQYAAGTPVTVWYVLANEETGIVNEPLRKIGDYADTVSGITIPTIAGANTLSVGATVQPSEVSVNYKGWHPVADVHERENGAWD